MIRNSYQTQIKYVSSLKNVYTQCSAMAEILTVPVRTLEKKRVSFTSGLCQTTIFEEDAISDQQPDSRLEGGYTLSDSEELLDRFVYVVGTR